MKLAILTPGTFEKKTGLPANELIGLKFTDLCDSKSILDAKVALESLLTDSPAENIRVNVKTQSGENIPCLLSLSEESDSAADYRMASFREISNVNTGGDNEANPLNRLHSILDTAVDAIIVINEYGFIESFNRAAENVFGYKEQEVKGKNIKLLMPMDRAEHHDQYLTNYIKTGHASIIGKGREVVALKRDGSTFSAELAISEVSINGQRMFTGTLRDISERKAFENRLYLQKEELNHTKELVMALLNTAVDAIITIDDRGTIESFNPAAEKLLKYKATDVIGNNIKLLMPKEYADAHDGYLEKFIETGEKHVIGTGREVVAMDKDGHTFPIELAVSEMCISGQKKFAGFIRDITQRKKFEEEIKRSNQQLDEFAYIASHDLKEPLRGINSYVNFIMEDYGEGMKEGMKDQLLSIQNLIKRLENFIDSLHYYSRIGKTESANSNVDLNECLEDALAVLKLRLDEKGATVIQKNPLPNVYGHGTRIGEIFNNLITNAVKYNNMDEKIIEIGCDYSQSTPVIYVKDNGIGIREQHLKSVFKIFKRLHGRDQYEGGTGIGLTIVKKIIEQHKGEVWVESEDKKGTTFHFTLPLKAPAENTPKQEETPAADTASGCPFH